SAPAGCRATDPVVALTVSPAGLLVSLVSLWATVSWLDAFERLTVMARMHAIAPRCSCGRRILTDSSSSGSSVVVLGRRQIKASAAERANQQPCRERDRTRPGDAANRDGRGCTNDTADDSALDAPLSSKTYGQTQRQAARHQRTHQGAYRCRVGI